MSGYSAAGTGEAWDVKSPKYMDLMPGYRYWISITNQSETAEVNTGTLTIEVADADENDMCKPGTFAPMIVGPDCSAPLGAVGEEAKYDLADHPLAPRQHCAVAFPCPKRFLRVVGAPATVDVVGGLTGLKRTGMGGTDPTQWPFGFQHMPPELYTAPIEATSGQAPPAARPARTQPPQPQPQVRPRTPAE